MERMIVVRSVAEIEECAKLIASSFDTVAQEFGLTRENASTNPAFLTPSKLTEYLNKPVILYGLLRDEEIVGCVAIEKSKRESRSFYIERLSVAPLYRHKGYGRKLTAFAVDTIRRMGGNEVSIGIMNKNKVLKDWYIRQGFIEKECKQIAHLPFEVCYMVKRIQE